MKSDHSHRMITLRLLVGYLGEKDQGAWWSSGFLGEYAARFIGPVFEGKTRLAQYHGVVEAACRVHDERIGVGRVFHLFRLPETLEQRMFDVLQQPSLPDPIGRCFDAQDTAREVLAGLAKGTASTTSGPVRIGATELVHSPASVSTLAAHYHAAFETGNPCFPYFKDPA